MTTTERPADLPADMPWHITPYDPGDEFDPCVYDGSMSIEDYDLMHRNIAKERRDSMKRKSTYRLLCVIPALLFIGSLFMGFAVLSVMGGIDNRLIDLPLGFGLIFGFSCGAGSLFLAAVWLDWRLRG